jgi:hypothetical protein
MSKKSGAIKVRSSLEGTEAVDEFMRELDHPLRPVLEAVRKTILGTHSEIGEGIKWNAPSFHFREYFATAGLRTEEQWIKQM